MQFQPTIILERFKGEQGVVFSWADRRSHGIPHPYSCAVLGERGLGQTMSLGAIGESCACSEISQTGTNKSQMEAARRGVHVCLALHTDLPRYNEILPYR